MREIVSTKVIRVFNEYAVKEGMPYKLIIDQCMEIWGKYVRRGYTMNVLIARVTEDEIICVTTDTVKNGYVNKFVLKPNMKFRLIEYVERGA